MAEELYALTKKQVAVLKEMLDWWKGMDQSRGVVGLEEHEVGIHAQSHDHYFAKTGGAGISAASDVGGVRVLGSGDCSIYKAVEDIVTGQRTLVDIGLTKEIFNISSLAVAPDTYIAVEREKFGTWFVDVESC
jgi:hypothetical protein